MGEADSAGQAVQVESPLLALGKQIGGFCAFCRFELCAERPMHRLLSTKGVTGGLNVERLGGRNVIAQPRKGNGVATVTEEKWVAVGTEDFPSDDRLNLRIHAFPEVDIVFAP